jgi:hypothetical protein
MKVIGLSFKNGYFYTLKAKESLFYFSWGHNIYLESSDQFKNAKK